MLEKQYLNAIIKRFDRLLPQADKFKQAASYMADAVLVGGKVWIYDKEWSLMVDANTRASGLAITSNYYSKSNKLTRADVLLIGSIEPDTADDIEIVKKVKSEGAKVIAFVSTSTTGMAAKGTLLSEVADVVIDNWSPEVKGVLSAEGTGVFGPTTGVMNDIIFWGVCAAFIDEMFSRGKIPSVYSGVHVSGGMDLYKRAGERREKLGY